MNRPPAKVSTKVKVVERRPCWPMMMFYTAVLALGLSQVVVANTYPLTDSRVIGKNVEYVVQPGDTAFKIASRNRVGFDELVAANQHVNKYWLKAGQKLVLPKQHILPSGPRKGIVINLAEKRLYYFHPNGTQVSTYPVSIGRQGWLTPVMNSTITEKRKNPTWRVPASIKAHNKKKYGLILPDTIPPGPDNPLGKYALRLAVGNILIHGTNHPNNIGIRASSGCIRLHPSTIEELYSMVPVGTTVRIVDQPYKAAKVGDNYYLEALIGQDELWSSHSKRRDALMRAIKSAVPINVYKDVWDVVHKVANIEAGYPIPINNF